VPLFKRHDATLVSGVSLTRAIMPFIMPTRTESAVYFEQTLDVTRAHEYIARRAAEDGAKLTFFHLYSYALVQTLGERPRLNRFTSGGNLYQRNAIELGFSAKKQLNDRSPLVVVKRAFDPSDSFDDHVARVLDAVDEARSSKPNQTDKELSIFLALPRVVLRMGVALLRWLDSVNLAPAALIGPDPLYSSVFIANLGSVGLEAAFHHLYEWGNCPIFAVVGRVRDEVRPDGSARKFVTVRYTFDERIEDGLYCARALDRLRQRVERWGEPMEDAL
jgi:pyruvate/2-oxoglutarate dehydrogenase complex dihydrolipoamide acyltransferase (E2) component